MIITRKRKIQMKERAEYLPAVISACTIDKQKGTVTVCFREGKGTAVTQSGLWMSGREQSISEPYRQRQWMGDCIC